MNPGNYENPYKGSLPTGDCYRYLTMSVPLEGLKYSSNYLASATRFFNVENNLNYQKNREGYTGYITINNSNIIGEVSTNLSQDAKYEGDEPILEFDTNEKIIIDASPALLIADGTFSDYFNGQVQYVGTSVSDNLYRYLTLWVYTNGCHGKFLSGTLYVTMKIYQKFQ